MLSRHSPFYPVEVHENLAVYQGLIAIQIRFESLGFHFDFKRLKLSLLIEVQQSLSSSIYLSLV